MRWMRCAWLVAGAVELISAWAEGAAGTSVPDTLGFTDASCAATLESALADRRDFGRWTLSCRIRGVEPTVDAVNVYERLVWHPDGNTECSVLAERDPGERRWTDFSALYLHHRIPQRRLDWVVGDLLPGWGMGLICARSAGMGSLPLAAPAADSKRIEYRSTSENRAVRGIALRRRSSDWQWTVLAGRARRDGRMDDAGQVVTLPESGYHVTSTERAGRDLLCLDVAAVRLLYERGAGGVGATLLHARFGRPVDLRRPDRKPWAFHGLHHGMAALDVHLQLTRLQLHGEGTLTRSGHSAAVLGARIRFTGLRWRVLLRHYAPGFVSFFGGAPSRGGMENEQGVMISVAGRRWELFADGYRKPERTYYYPYGATITAAGGRIATPWSGPFRGAMRVRLDRRPYWRDERTVFHHGNRLRLDLEHSRSHNSGELTRLRLETRRLQRQPGADEWGCAVSLLCKRSREPGQAVVQLTRYLTESYYSAIYEYEYDLPGMVTVRPLHRQGWRINGVLRLALVSWEISGRYRLERRGSLRHYFGIQLDVAAAN